MCCMLQSRIPLNTGSKKQQNGSLEKGEYEVWWGTSLGKNKCDRVILRCASKLRNDIFTVQSKQICASVTVDNIMEGEAIPPDSVKSLFKMLHMGNLSRIEELSSRKSWLIDSSAADAVFCCSAGKIIPGKQLSLGFTLKSMTGSKKVLTLMNRYGHCASNETVRRVDKSLESTLNNSDSFIPDKIKSNLTYQQEQLGITPI